MGFFREQKAGALWKGAFSRQVSEEPSPRAPWWLCPFSGSPGVRSWSGPWQEGTVLLLVEGSCWCSSSRQPLAHR